MLPRTWTQDKVSSWKNARDQERQKQGRPPFDDLDASEKKTALATQRAELYKASQLKLKSLAWPLEKYPLATYFAAGPGTLQLPRYYLSEVDCDRVSSQLFSVAFGDIE
jgi:hypothetical protein